MRKKSTYPIYPSRCLNDGELVTAAIHCFDNAKELLDEAELLRGLDRSARACALAATGFQELGKAHLCAGLLAKDPTYAEYTDPKKFWGFWKDHVGKAATVFRVGVEGTFYGPVQPERAEDLGDSLESIRRLGFYVDVHDMQPPEPPPGFRGIGFQRGPTFLLPADKCSPRIAADLIRDLSLFVQGLSPAIEEMRETRAVERAKFATDFLAAWNEAKRARESQSETTQ